MNGKKGDCNVFTFGLSCHIWAESEDEAWRKVADIKVEGVEIVERELVEEYDPREGKVIA